MFGVGHFLERRANAEPNKLALISDDKELSYGELNQRVNRLANNLMKLGLAKGDKVAYLFKNSVEAGIIWFATQKTGAVAVPLNYRLLPREIKTLTEFVGCKVLIYGSEFTDAIEWIKKEGEKLPLFICGGEFPRPSDYNLTDLWTNGSAEEPAVEIGEDDISVILFTSGTTGMPKGIVRTHKIVYDYAMMMAGDAGSGQDDILLTHCQMFHTAGMGLLMKFMALGGTFIILNRFDPCKILEHIEKYRVSQLFLLPPIMYIRLSEVESWPKYDLSSVREVQTSGGECSLDYVLKMFELFPQSQLRTSYGATEFCAATRIIMSKDFILENPKRVKNVGRLNPLVEMRLIDESGHDVAPGEVGEAIVRSSMVFKEYWDNPELTAAALKDGWYYTEDWMVQDQDGLYYLMGRKRDMIKTGGENVYAQEVEYVLRTHPAIEDCAVIGVPDQKFGEAIAAAIVLKKGGRLSAAEVITYFQSVAASYKKPRYLAFLDALPFNSVGKVQKSVLYDQWEKLFMAVES